MDTMKLLRLQPQDKVVVLEKDPDDHQRWIETTYYVHHVEQAGQSLVHVMDERGCSRKAIPFVEVVDIEKAKRPITGIVDPEIWDRFHGDPKYRDRPVRLLQVCIFENRIHKYCVPLWPDGNTPSGQLSELSLSWSGFEELDTSDQTRFITSMPAYGWCNHRVGDAETRRRRIYRTARNRVHKALHGKRSKWLRGAVDEEPA